MKGYTLLELLVVVLIIGVLTAIAVPQYFNAVENARMVELKVVWGSQRHWATGKNLTEQQQADINARLRKHPLHHFTGEVICRTGAPEGVPCFEVVFTRKANAAAQYQITTLDNFKKLACVPTNVLGTQVCKSRSIPDGEITIGEQKAYLIH